ncbi:tRNA-uridine aminocarboxypropyltransferase 2 [Hirundo rustica]|uniref:tRNA-uridine aminocarboxypropyltransferase 2 n=1 Tax=Hirundo rustica TaxID=43150 RepID=UPI00267249F5|nr:tRNA-uridine aminocarboxypropyltransferase 2 [Hirundo rustica]
MEGSGDGGGAHPGLTTAPGGEGDGCEGLWELPVEHCERRPVCGRCRYPELATVCRNSNTLILYPGADATNLEEVAMMSSSPSVMIIIDGTWSQAKDIFYKNSLFRLPKQVQLKPSISSQYVIRTQPTNTCLSTLECAAVALSIMEKNKSIQETILHPLQALCSFQLQYGAQIHHSKEHLLKNGLYDKPMPKNKRKLRRMELLVNNVKI